MYHIKNSLPVPWLHLLLSCREQASATLHEAMGRQGCVDSRIRPLAPGMRICGPALTVQCQTGDNLMLSKAISMAEAGQIIVLDAGGAADSGSFGEVLATECSAKRLGGLATTGSVRDSERLIQMNFPMFSAGISIRGTSKAGLGTINHPISFGGAVVHPGDLVVGDRDGLVVVPSDEVEAVLKKALLREAEEGEVMERIRAGESFFVIKDHQKILDSLGCREER